MLASIMMLLVVFFSSTIIANSQKPMLFNFGGRTGFLPEDVLILILFFAMFLKLSFLKSFKKLHSPLTLPLSLFVLMTIFAVFNGVIYHQAEWLYALRPAKALMNYLLFFPIIFFIDDKKKLKFFLNGLLFLGVLSSVCMIIQYLAGSDRRFFFSESWFGVGSVEELSFSDVTRAIPPARSLVFFLVIMSLSFLVTKRNRLKYLGLSFLFLIGLIITFTRSMWIAAIICSVFFFCFMIKRKHITLAVVFLITAFLIMLVIVNSGLLNNNRYFAIISERLSSVFSSEVWQEKGSAGLRIGENKMVLDKLGNEFILGRGLGAPVYYKSDILGFSIENDVPIATFHNGFITILYCMGLTGLSIFIWLIIATLRRGFLAFKKIKDPEMKYLALSLTMAFIGFLIAGNFETTFIGQYFSITCIILSLGLIEVIWRLNDNEAK